MPLTGPAAVRVFACKELVSLRYIHCVESGVLLKLRATEENNKKCDWYNWPFVLQLRPYKEKPKYIEDGKLGSAGLTPCGVVIL